MCNNSVKDHDYNKGNLSNQWGKDCLKIKETTGYSEKAGIPYWIPVKCKN